MSEKRSRAGSLILIFFVGITLFACFTKFAFRIYKSSRKKRVNMKNAINTFTGMGEIVVQKEVIAQYAGTVAVECFGIVGMACVSYRDGFVKLLHKENITQGINVSIVDNKLRLEFHIIVAYGVSIQTVIANLLDSVKFRVERFAGLEIDKIDVFVEDVRLID